MLPQRRSVEAAVANMLIWLNTNLRSASHSLTRFGFFRTVLLAAENEQDGAVCVVSRGGGVCAPGGLLQLVAAAGMVAQGSDWSDLGSAGCPMGLWTIYTVILSLRRRRFGQYVLKFALPFP